MSNDPLGSSTPALSQLDTNYSAGAAVAPVTSISPLAPRSPLPGQRQFRSQPPPPPPFDAAWSVNTPAQPIARSLSEQGQEESAGWSPQRASADLVPRDAQGQRSLSRERRDAADYNDTTTGTPGNRVAGEEGPAPMPGFVRIKIVGLEKNRRDIYIKFSAESNLPGFRNSTYRSISRSYTEFAAFCEAIAVNNPQAIIPALPMSQTSAQTEEEDDRLIKANFQVWCARLTGDAMIARDDEMRNFIESEFSYTPNNRQKRRTPSTFHFPRSSRSADDQDDDLTLAKSAMVRLETAFLETAKVIEKIAKARRAVAVGYAEVGEQMVGFATTENHAPLAAGIKKLARTTKILGDLQLVQASNDQVTLGDGLTYQAANARSAKDTLVNRNVLLEEHRTAVKLTIAKRRNIERLKSSSSIKADRVDEALDELAEAKKNETLLSLRLTNISQHLLPSLRSHSVSTHADIFATLLEHARRNVIYESQLLKEVELVRPEIKAIKTTLVGPGEGTGVYYHPVGTEGHNRGRNNDSPLHSPTRASSLGTARAQDNRGAERRSIAQLAQSVQLGGSEGARNQGVRQRVDAKMAASMLSGF